MSNKKIGESLLRNDSTRLRFSVWVIIANFIIGIVGMILGSDLTALGAFLAMSNTPLYAYILGRSFRGATVPEKYYEQEHSGSGGIERRRGRNDYEDDDYHGRRSSKEDNYNMPLEETKPTEIPKTVETVKKDKSEIG